MFNYDEYFKKQFGKRMLLARKRAGLTQTQVAQLMGDSWYQQNVKDVEKGIRTPLRENVEKFAKIYNTSVEYLLYGEEDPYTIEETSDGYVATFNHSVFNSKTSDKSLENIEKKIKKLKKDNLSFVSDVCNAIYLYQENEELEKQIKEKEESFNSELLSFRKRKR